MTTTVTVKTHDWPVAVEASHNHNHASDHVVSRSYGSTTTFVPAHTEATFNVTDTQTISVRELAKGATGLEEPKEAECAGDRTYPTAAQADIADAGLTVEG